MCVPAFSISSLVSLYQQPTADARYGNLTCNCPGLQPSKQVLQRSMLLRAVQVQHGDSQSLSSVTDGYFWNGLHCLQPCYRVRNKSCKTLGAQIVCTQMSKASTVSLYTVNSHSHRQHYLVVPHCAALKARRHCSCSLLSCTNCRNSNFEAFRHALQLQQQCARIRNAVFKVEEYVCVVRRAALCFRFRMY